MEETIKEAAHSARRLRPVLRSLMWATITGAGLMIVAGIALFIVDGQRKAGASNALFMTGLLGLPVIGVSLGVSAGRQNRQNVWRKLHDLFLSEHATAEDSLSPPLIGPLLEVVILGESDCCRQSSVKLLSRMLKSVQAGQEVVLTAHQRSLLHTLVIQERWGWLPLQDGNGLEAERSDLRPAAIGALGLLGDSTSIPILERFVRKAKDPDLCASALRSIEQIRERLRYGPEHLLRAGKAPERPDTLLRAVLAGVSQNTDPQQLLRAEKAEPER